MLKMLATHRYVERVMPTNAEDDGSPVGRVKDRCKWLMMLSIYEQQAAAYESWLPAVHEVIHRLPVN